MNKPKFYDDAPTLSGDFVPLAPGGYVCEIKKAVEQNAQKSGNPMLVLLLDIAEGERKGYFQDRFDKDTREDKKWGCVLRIVMDDPNKTVDERKKIAGRLKGAIASIEMSNNGFKYDWKEESLKGKKVGGEFGLEEYTAQDGSTRTACKIRRLRSIDSIEKGIDMPNVKLLDGTYMSYDDYEERLEESKSAEKDGEYITVDSLDDLPF